MCAALLARNVPAIPPLLIAYGRYAVTRIGQADIIYWGEGWNASVAVSRLPGGVLNYHNAGKVQASSEPQDMRLQRMLGHMTTLIPKDPKRVLVIGCGAGVTAGAASIDPRVESLTIAEIEPLVPRVVSTYFAEHNFNVVKNPKTTVHLDDARHYLQTTDEKFDAITSDPLDPWVKGAAMLYTREFFELAKQHLNPGGVVTLFVQLYESNTEAVKSEIATFMEAFPNGVVWGNTQEGRGYDLVLLGQLTPTPINVDEIEQRLQRPEYAQVRLSLSQIGMNSAVDLFSTYAGTAAELAAVAEGREHQPRSQPASPVPRGARPEPLSERVHLRQHAGVCERLSERPVRGLGRDDQRAPRRDPQGAGAVGARARESEPVQGSRFRVQVRFRVRWVGSGFCFGMVSISEAAARHAVKVSHDRLVGDTAVEQVDVTTGLGHVSRIVRRDADGCAIGVQLGEHVHQRIAALRIEVARRLVGERIGGRPAMARATATSCW